MPLSKNQTKFIKSLHLKKYRTAAQCFIVEGEKNVAELLKSNWQVDLVVYTAKFAEKYVDALAETDLKTPLMEARPEELTNISTLENNMMALAVVQMPKDQHFQLKDNQLTIILDNIQDPGNLGTIIRVCDWYGLTQVVCSEDCVDLYNPKVISATKGSFLRVNAFYTPLEHFLQTYTNVTKYGAMLQGQNIHETQFAQTAFLIVGNESQGIAPEIQKLIHVPLTIPKFGQAESLNVGIATAIFCDNWKQRASSLEDISF